MKTPICPTCGCSLVRLGIGKEDAVAHTHAGTEHHFCCEGCLEQFTADPEKHLQETKGLIVCPVCLTEKPLGLTRILNFDGQNIHFCRCPHCMDEFNKNPEYFLRRLAGEEDYAGVFKAAVSPEASTPDA